MSKVLLIDDDASLREVLAFTLREQGHEVAAFPDGESGLAALGSFAPEAVISDLKMPGIDGLEVLRRVHARDATVPVLLLTAFGSIEDAVAAMKLGAYDYLTKPYNRDELKVTLDLALERRRLLQENRRLRDRLREQTLHVELVHASAAMQAVLELVRRIAPTSATVLISGETGSGKEVVAQALHAYSDRWERPLVAVNCAAIPRELMESELFGHVRGAFTGAVKDKPGKFQQADGGTLFLDEIADLAPELQTKLLRAIETGLIDVVGGTQPSAVDVRLIAATHADLAELVRQGAFRNDLYYRLNVIPVHLPPLRERPDDIPALWEHFVGKFAPGAALRTSPGLMRVLMRQPWPGNVRELANLCQRMVLLRSDDELNEAGLAALSDRTPGQVREGPAGERGRSFLGDLPPDRLSLPELEREVIVRALAKHGGNRTRTAEYLGVPRHVLLYRLAKFGIE